LTDWKQVLHEHFPKPVNAMMVFPEHDRSLAANFQRAIDLFLIKTLNEKTPRDRQYINLAPGGDHVFHKELMMAPMDHLHRFQELYASLKSSQPATFQCGMKRCKWNGST
jgi:hypothetical protein